MRNVRADRDAIHRLWLEGKGDTAIADALTLSPRTIGKIRQEMGLKSHTSAKFWNGARDAELLRLLRAHLSYIRIAKALGCSDAAVGRRVRELQLTAIPTKPGAQAPVAPLTLSPAMRHLAKFDSVIAARVQREGEGQ